MSITNKKVDVDIDGDGVPDLKVSLREIMIVVGGVISLVMTYTTLKNDIEINKKYYSDYKKQYIKNNNIEMLIWEILLQMMCYLLRH